MTAGSITPATVAGVVIGVLVGAVSITGVGYMGRSLDDSPERLEAAPFDESYCDDIVSALDTDLLGAPTQTMLEDGPDTLVSCVASIPDSTFQLVVSTISNGSTSDRSRDERVASSLLSSCQIATSVSASDSCQGAVASPEGEFVAFVTDDEASVVTIVRTGSAADGSIPFTIDPVHDLLRADGRP